MGAEPERPNLVARLRGDEPGPVLGYLSHVDTVLADPDDWTHDPWSGEIHDGHLWGRGTLDMKGQTAAEVVAAATLARKGWRPARGELKVIAVVDEEVGGRLGAQWLTEERPDVARVDWLVNEGGGPIMPYGDRRICPRLRRREGHLPLPRDRARGRRPRLVPRHTATTRCSSSRRCSPGWASASPPSTSWPSRAPCWRRSARTRPTRRRRPTACARSSRAWRAWSSRRCA